MGFYGCFEKINSSDVRQVVTKRNWSSGTTYDMYRHDYSRTNTAKVSGATNLYAASYYVINSDLEFTSAYKMVRLLTLLTEHLLLTNLLILI